MKEGEPQPEAEQSVDDRVREILRSFQTTEGKEIFAHLALRHGVALSPELIELSLGYTEKSIPLGVDAQEEAARLRDYCESLGVNQERLEQIEGNVKKYQQQQAEVDPEYKQYVESRHSRDLATIEEARKQGYELDVNSAERAIESGDYELGYVILINTPGNAARDPIRTFLWAKHKNNPETLEAFRTITHRRLDERASILDKRSIGTKGHTENLVSQYLEIGDYSEAARRAEINPGSIARHDIQNPEFQELRKKFEEFDRTMWAITRFPMLNEEALKERVREMRQYLGKEEV